MTIQRLEIPVPPKSGRSFLPPPVRGRIPATWIPWLRFFAAVLFIVGTLSLLLSTGTIWHSIHEFRGQSSKTEYREDLPRLIAEARAKTFFYRLHPDQKSNATCEPRPVNKHDYQKFYCSEIFNNKLIKIQCFGDLSKTEDECQNLDVSKLLDTANRGHP